MPRSSLPAGHPRGRAFRAWRAYLLAKPGALERHPFDSALPVYFVKARMFAVYAGKPGDESLALKCWPDWSVALRAEHPAITAAYHMNKKHWNGVRLDGSLPRGLVKKLVDHSYDLVSGRLKAWAQAEGRGVPRRGARP